MPLFFESEEELSSLDRNEVIEEECENEVESANSQITHISESESKD